MNKNRTANYYINDIIFNISYNDITSIEADVIVSSDDGFISMGGGVSAAIWAKGGSEIKEEAQNHIPLKVGSVVVTGAGSLRSKYIFHGITIDYRSMEYLNSQYLASIVSKCLILSESLGVKSISFPALGTGVARFPFEDAAVAMTNEIINHVKNGSSLERINLCLYARENVSISNVNLFYERAGAIAATIAQGQQLDLKLNEIKLLLLETNRKDLLPLVDRIKDSIINSSADDLLDNQSLLKEVNYAKEIEGVNANSVFTEEDSIKLNIQLLQTKLSGLYTMMNVKQTNLNSYLVEEAKYGGVMVPIRLTHSISDVRQEMEEINSDIIDLKKEIDSILS